MWHGESGLWDVQAGPVPAVSAGGDTPVQYVSLVKYSLDEVIRQHRGVIIGMSAGSINLTKTALYTATCVNSSVEPHFDRENVTDELMQSSEKCTICDLCDDGVIVCANGKTEFYGKVQKLSERLKN